MIGTLFGLLLMVATPPFQSPDEQNHYARAYHVSNGGLMGVTQDNLLGVIIPPNLIDLYFGAIKTEAGEIAGHPDIKFPLHKFKQGFSFKINTTDSQFMLAPNTASYPFTFYLPHAIGIALGKTVLYSELGIFYSGRLFGLIFYLLSGWIILNNSSKPHQEIFFTCLLLPMPLFLAAMYTADTVSTLIAYFAITYYLTLRQEAIPINEKNLWKILLIAFCIGLIKPVYVFLSALIFLLPFSSQLSNLKNILIRIGVIAISLIGVVTVTLLGKGSQVTMRSDVDPNIQLAEFLHHPFKFILLSGTYFFDWMPDYYTGVIGVLGVLDTILPGYAYYLGLALMLFLILQKNPEEKTFLWRELGLLSLAFVSCILATLLFLFITWSPTKAWIIEGFQGRYLLPILPIILIVFRSLIGMNIRCSKAWLIGGVFLLQVITIYTVINRYYIPSQWFAG